jgi:hypothetical protein
MSYELVAMLAAKLGVALDDTEPWPEGAVLSMLQWYLDAHDGGVTRGQQWVVGDARWRQESADWRRLGDVGMALSSCPFKVRVAFAEPGSLASYGDVLVCPALPAAEVAAAKAAAAERARCADSERAARWLVGGAPIRARRAVEWRAVDRLARLQAVFQRGGVYLGCVGWLGRRFARAAGSDPEFGAALRAG